MDMDRLIAAIIKLMGEDYAVMLSIVVLFQSCYVMLKNIRSIKAPSVFVMTFIVFAYVVLYEYGSVRWELLCYDTHISKYDTNLWVVIDFVGLMVSAGWLYVIDCMLNKLILKEIERFKFNSRICIDTVGDDGCSRRVCVEDVVVDEVTINN